MSFLNDPTPIVMNTLPILIQLVLYGSFLSTAVVCQSGPGIHPCAIGLENGSTLQVDSIAGIGPGSVHYATAGSLHDLPRPEVRSIRCGDQEYILVADHLQEKTTASTTLAGDPEQVMANGSPPDHLGGPAHRPGSVDPNIALLSATERRTLGKADAKQYYHGIGPFIGSACTGILGSVIFAAFPPAASRVGRNPNAALYATDPEYRIGYRKAAHKKKALMCFGGMSLGIFILVAAGY